MRLRSAATAGALAVMLLAGCDAGAESYVFNSDRSPVDVDTPALRAQKAAAGIEPCPKTTAPPSPSPRALPDVTLPCLGGGRSVDISRLRGPLLLNFWAQNCITCRRESPAMQAVYDRLSGRLTVIGVDWQDTQPDQALGFAQEVGITYPQLADPVGATRAALEIRGLPVTVFVTRSGEISYVSPAPITSSGELAALVEDHLGLKVPGLS
jgi:thiol-disulfide isomerase/thioredoxin